MGGGGRGEASSDHAFRSALPKPSQMHTWWDIIIVMDTSHGCSRLDTGMQLHDSHYHRNIHKGGIQGGTVNKVRHKSTIEREPKEREGGGGDEHL